MVEGLLLNFMAYVYFAENLWPCTMDAELKDVPLF